MRSPRLLFRITVIVCFVFCASTAVLAGDEWRTVDPAELASKTSVVEKDADAEALFWEVHVADDIESGRKVLTHYIRIKIFTERGKESQSRIDIPFVTGSTIKDVLARTIKPDGSIIEIKKDAVFERTIAKASGVKVKAKSFAMPGVEPGSIIEYQWKEIWDRISIRDRFELQRDIPVQVVRYYLKPAHFDTFSAIGLNAKTFHGETTPFVKVKDGYFMTSMSNVPAFHEEPRMPPEDEVRAWMLVWYTSEENLPPDSYWAKWGRDEYEGVKPSLKVTGDVRNAASEAVGDATTDEQKLRRLYQFCQTKIRNSSSSSSGLTAEERAKLKENKTAADTLKHGVGNGWEIDVLFAALATAAGYDARVARVVDRGRYFFNINFPNGYFLRSYDVAVRLGDQWRFFDPGAPYLPFDMLRWEEEGQKALIPDAKAPAWVQTPMSLPEKTKRTCTAKLRLTEDGALEGDVRIEFIGHSALEKRQAFDGDSAGEVESSVRDEITSRMSTADLSNIRTENLRDPSKPLVYSYHVRVDGYAAKTGKRLFLQPEFFQHGASPLFTLNERRYPIYFHYPWMEVDQVEIELPTGYTLDNADAPPGINAGTISRYEPKIAISNDGRELIYRRSFFFGGGGNILFPASSYGQLKALFDEINKRDNHTITLKQTGS